VTARPTTMRHAALASVMLGLALPAALVGLTGLTSTACTLTLPGSSDAGATGTSTAEAGVGTVGQVCTQILTELCTQAIDRCGYSYTIPTCVQGDMSMCCLTTCSEESDASASTVSSCKSAFDDEDCNAVTVGTTPSECTTLIGM
jgi:hypothetical protein